MHMKCLLSVTGFGVFRYFELHSKIYRLIFSAEAEKCFLPGAGLEPAQSCDWEVLSPLLRPPIRSFGIVETSK